MSDSRTYSEALHDFYQVERELNLPEWRVCGVYVWKLVRVKIFRASLLAKNISGDFHPGSKRSKVLHVLSFPLDMSRHNPFLQKGAVDRIVLPSRRVQKIQTGWIDPITLRAWEGERFQGSMVLEEPFGVHNLTKRKFSSAVTLSKLGWLAAKKYKVPLSSADILIIRTIGHKLQLFKNYEEQAFYLLFQRSIASFFGVKSIYSSLFSKFKPKAFYTTCSYGKEAQISAAFDLGIKTAELQHGIVEPGHLGYDFPGWDRVPYFPDYFLSWGRRWLQGLHFPKVEKSVPVGSTSMSSKIVREARDNPSRNRKELLVISQGSIAWLLHSAIIEFSRERPDWSIVVRPHPNENVAMWSASLRGADSSCRSKIEVTNSMSLQEAARAAQVVLGVYSTALIEALAYGCRLVILRTPETPPFLQSLLEDGSAISVSNGGDLAEKVDRAPLGDVSGYFCDPIEDICCLVE